MASSLARIAPSIATVGTGDTELAWRPSPTDAAPTECTYDKPSNRRRNPAPQYIEALEGRVQRAETLLRRFIPDVDLSDPNLDPAVQQEFRNRQLARARAAGGAQQGEPSHEVDERDGQLLSMIRSIGQLDLDEKGGWDFHGASSGAVFLRL